MNIYINQANCRLPCFYSCCSHLSKINIKIHNQSDMNIYNNINIIAYMRIDMNMNNDMITDMNYDI